jgi:MFS family permease
MHLFTAFYFVIVLALEADWGLPYHELIELWTLGALLVGVGAIPLVGVGAIPAGWLSDRWSAPGMMIVMFLGLGLSGIACAFLDTPTALLLGLASIGLFSAIYHPVGIAWLVKSADRPGRALGINGIFGSLGIAAAGLLAGGLIDLHGWRAAFVVPGVISLLTGFALFVCLRLGLVAEGSARRTPPKASRSCSPPCSPWASSSRRPRRPCPRSSISGCATWRARGPSGSAPWWRGSTSPAASCRCWAAISPTATRSSRSIS